MENSQYSNKIGLVIERTSNGLNYDYVSPGLNKQELGRLQISFDETNQVGQFNRGYCYSIQRTDRHLIYSLISTDQKDSANRNGFYAVRIIVSPNELIENVFTNLGRVARVYLGYLNANNLINQNYDATLNQVAGEIKRRNWVTPGIVLDRTVYYQFINLKENQSDLFNNPKLSYASKVYFLNDQSAQSDGVARQFGFEPLANFWNKIREIQFLNPERLQVSLTVDHYPYTVSSDKFLVVCKAAQVVKYKIPQQTATTVGAGEKEVSIQTPEVVFRTHGQDSPSSSNHKHKNTSAFPWLVGISIGLIGGYFVQPLMGKYVFNDTIDSVEQMPAAEVSIPALDIDTTAVNVIHLIDKGGYFKNLGFKYDGKSKKWFMKDNLKAQKASFHPLTLASLDTLFDSPRIIELKAELDKFTSTPIPGEGIDKQPNEKVQASAVNSNSSSAAKKKESSKEQKEEASREKTVKKTSLPDEAVIAKKSSPVKKVIKEVDTAKKTIKH